MGGWRGRWGGAQQLSLHPTHPPPTPWLPRRISFLVTKKDFLVGDQEGFPSWLPRRISFFVTKKDFLLRYQEGFPSWKPRRISFLEAKKDFLLGNQEGYPSWKLRRISFLESKKDFLPTRRSFLVSKREILLGYQEPERRSSAIEFQSCIQFLVHNSGRKCPAWLRISEIESHMYKGHML